MFVGRIALIRRYALNLGLLLVDILQIQGVKLCHDFVWNGLLSFDVKRFRVV